MNAKYELTWEQIFEQSTPKEREEITILMVAYVEKKRELVDDPFPFTTKTWGELPWLLRRRRKKQARQQRGNCNVVKVK